jgi:hypothetical protein
MPARKRFELDILCPSCGATGDALVSDALVSENDDTDPQGAAFRVEAYPPGFSEERRSTSRHETIVACGCGQVFYLL